MLKAGRKGSLMNAKLKNRIKDRTLKRSAAVLLLDEAGYVILSFAALWASVRFSDWTRQFLVLSVILGLKWVFGNRTQVIQIFNPERKEPV